MPIYTIEDTATGKRYKVEGDSPPTEADIASLLQNRGDPVRQDSFAENTLDVAGEVAAGANRAAMYIPDTLVGGVNAIAGTDITKPSDAIASLTGHKPGQGGFMDEGAARDAAGAFGEVMLPGAAGLKAVQGRNLASVPGAAAEFLGFGSASPAGKAVAISDEVARDLSLKRGSGDSVAAGYRLDEFGKVRPDQSQNKALKAGLDEGIVAQIASGSPADKRRMAEMLDIVERGRKNKTYADFNSPRLALGDSLVERYKAVKGVNKKAGEALSKAKTDLKSRPANLAEMQEPVLKPFLNDLNDLGVRLDPDGQIYFKGSDFEGLPEAQGIINELKNVLFGFEVRSAYDLHRLKKFIDNRVEFGVQTPGVKGDAITVLKNLRHNANEFLKAKHTDYAKANELYSDTIGLLKETQDLVGKKNEVSERELGRVARQGLSNAQRSGRVQDLLENLDAAAKRYGVDVGDDVQRQASFVQTLEKLFNVSPPASFKGDISKAVDQAVDAAGVAAGGSAGIASAALRGAGRVFKKSDAQRQDELISALRELINDGRTPPP